MKAVAEGVSAGSSAAEAETNASKLNSAASSVTDPQLAPELFLLITKTLVAQRNFETLLELSLANKSLASLGTPILAKVPVQTVWLALKEIEDQPYKGWFRTQLVIHLIVCEKWQAQEIIEDERELLHLEDGFGD